MNLSGVSGPPAVCKSVGARSRVFWLYLDNRFCWLNIGCRGDAVSKVLWRASVSVVMGS